jgi:3-deoxy-D-arabino-heptulosonate 7-phosphate (DAHP) synthase class II
VTYDLGMGEMWARTEAHATDYEEQMIRQAEDERREREVYEQRAYDQWLQDQWIDSLETEDFESYEAMD